MELENAIEKEASVEVRSKASFGGTCLVVFGIFMMIFTPLGILYSFINFLISDNYIFVGAIGSIVYSLSIIIGGIQIFVGYKMYKTGGILKEFSMNGDYKLIKNLIENGHKYLVFNMIAYILGSISAIFIIISVIQNYL